MKNRSTFQKDPTPKILPKDTYSATQLRASFSLSSWKTRTWHGITNPKAFTIFSSQSVFVTTATRSNAVRCVMPTFASSHAAPPVKPDKFSVAYNKRILFCLLSFSSIYIYNCKT